MANTSREADPKFDNMKTALTGQFKTVFALTAASQPAVLATLFGVNMVFRFLKFGARLRKVYEEEHKQFDQTVRTQGVVLMPVHIRPTTTLVETFFLSGMAKSAFPEEYKSMKDQIDIYKKGSFMERRVAAKKLEVAHWLMNQGKDWRNNQTLMDLVNATIKAPDAVSFRDMVEALEPIYGKEFIGFNDFDALLEDYAMQDLEALNLNINKLQGQSIHDLRSTVKEMFWDTMLFGDDNTVKNTLFFIGRQKLHAQQERLENLRAKMDESEDDEQVAELKKRIEDIEEEIDALDEFKGDE